MCAEKNTNKKERIITCGWCDGITEMIMGCFPDDAGYSACLARMNENLRKSCGQKTSEAVNEEN